VRGGRVTVISNGLDAQTLTTCRLAFGSRQTRPLLASPTLLVGTVPDAADAETIRVVQQDRQSDTLPFAVATPVAENLHPVANPAIDRAGNVYTTISGTKGQHVQTSIYKITSLGEVEPFAAGITNPTGLAFGPDDALYVSSRHEGALYRVDEQGNVFPFAEGLGIATGLAFDAEGSLYVGDRRGTIFRLSDSGEAESFATLGPSAAAYHLAYGPDNGLYVSYPTLSGDDRIYRVSPDGAVQTFVRGLGLAQGLAFDEVGNLYVTAHIEGVGGVVRITPAGDIQPMITGVNLVGLAFGIAGELFLVDKSALYKLNFGIQGRPLL
jgi:sugar lactone lactonase YvrE